MHSGYWLFREPESDDYNRSFFVTGLSYHPIRLPRRWCSECGGDYATGWPLGVPCPADVRKTLHRLRQLDKWCVSEEEFAELAEEVEAALRRNGHEIRVEPGDEFQPLVWEVPSRPRQDFFWPGPGDIVVSPRVKALFEEHGISGVEFHRVQLGRVGAMEPWEEFPPSDSGEPLALGDPTALFDILPLLSDPDTAGQFYEMLFRTHTRRMVAYRPDELKCTKCGIPKVDFPVEKPAPLLPRSLVPDVDVFTSHLIGKVVSDKVERVIREYRLNGCTLAPVTIQ